MLGHRLRRRPPRHDADRDAGTSLVEAMIAMFVIATVFGGLAGLLIQSLSSLRGSKDFETATQLVNLKLEEARALPSDTLAAGALDTDVAANVTGGQETRLGGTLPGRPYTYNGETLRTNSTASASTTSRKKFYEPIQGALFQTRSLFASTS